MENTASLGTCFSLPCWRKEGSMGWAPLFQRILRKFCLFLVICNLVSLHSFLKHSLLGLGETFQLPMWCLNLFCLILTLCLHTPQVRELTATLKATIPPSFSFLFWLLYSLMNSARQMLFISYGATDFQGNHPRVTRGWVGRDGLYGVFTMSVM